MSLPYFCTRCNRQHVRGAIYTQHQQFKDSPTNTVQELADHVGIPVSMLRYDPDTVKPGVVTGSECTLAQAEREVNAPIAHIMEVVTPTKEEVLAAVDAACAEAAIPLECQPTVVVKDHVEKWEPRMDFQRNTPFPDRAIEAVQHESMPAMKRGKPVKKRRWWQWRWE